MVFATARFADLTRRVAASFSMPDARTVVVDHPLGGTDPAVVAGWADASVEQLVRLLTG